ncbi:Aldehyde dehydrogenase [Nesidiocoris tenuis]|nr:Aldehyde dehydrogenase [Nesidiocoris tenuis]
MWMQIRRLSVIIPQPNRTPKMPPQKLFINNEWVSPAADKKFELVNPTNEKVFGECALADKEDIETAVDAAKKAFRRGSAWRSMDASRRGFLINRLADLVERDAALLSSLEAIECGKVFSHTLKGDVQKAISVLRYYAGYADKHGGEVGQPNGKFVGYTKQEPLGVAACIVSWNFSLMITMWKLAAALAAGCTTVLKPSQYSSLAVLHIGNLAKEVGFPPGVVNIVTGPGKIGSHLVENTDVDVVSFTGSTSVGVEIYRKAADTMKRLVLELGGKSANIILKDADLDGAVEHAHLASFHNQGQCCAAGSRTFVHESMYEKFVDKMKERLTKKKIGDPLDLDVDHGPQTTKDQAEIVMRYIEAGQREGACLEAGGKRLERPGYFIEPTIFSNVTDDMTIAKEEIFGPVMQILSYKDIEEVIDRANSSEYGLAASVFGSDIDDIYTVAEGVRAGSCWVNCTLTIEPALPFGGYQMSGIGREGGRLGIQAFTEAKSVFIRTKSKNS